VVTILLAALLLIILADAALKTVPEGSVGTVQRVWHLKGPQRVGPGRRVVVPFLEELRVEPATEVEPRL
jgi:hypothetical protein